jgi:hypothetical protein
VPFSVVPLCEGETNGLSDLDAVTTASATGIADAITQPFTNESPAYVSTSWDGSGWAFWEGNGYAYGVALLCQATLDQASITPASVGFRLPRIWSNRGAKGDGDPCPDVFASRQIYFNAAPEIVGGAMPTDGVATKGLILPASGGTATIPVHLYSDGPTGEWTLSAAERTDLDFQSSPVLSFSFDRARGRSGDVRHLTISRAAPGDDGPAPGLAFEIVSTLGDVKHEWIVAVGND